MLSTNLHQFNLFQKNLINLTKRQYQTKRKQRNRIYCWLNKIIDFQSKGIACPFCSSNMANLPYLTVQFSQAIIVHLPCSLSAIIEPPCTSTICFTIDNPNPKPPPRFLFACVNVFFCRIASQKNVTER